MQPCPHGSKLLGDSFAIELRQAPDLPVEHHGRLRPRMVSATGAGFGMHVSVR